MERSLANCQTLKLLTPFSWSTDNSHTRTPVSPPGLTFECLLSRFQKLLGWARRGQDSFHALPSSRYCTEDPHLSWDTVESSHRKNDRLLQLIFILVEINAFSHCPGPTIVFLASSMNRLCEDRDTEPWSWSPVPPWSKTFFSSLFPRTPQTQL